MFAHRFRNNDARLVVGSLDRANSIHILRLVLLEARKYLTDRLVGEVWRLTL
jgi:hypothetical protein